MWGERECVLCGGERVYCVGRERVYGVCVYVKEGNIQCYIVCIGNKHVLTIYYEPL